MHTVLLHLERLRRHYEISVRSHDHVALLDLSHSLRVWSELKTVLPTLEPKFGSTLAFRTALPAKKVMRAARGYSFVFSYMPGGVVTFASNGMLAGRSGALDASSPFTIGAQSMRRSDGAIELSNYCYISTSFEQPMIAALGAEQQKRCNYAHWLGAEVVRLSYPSQVPAQGMTTVSLSREILVKRVANTLDGSHPSAAGNSTTDFNSNDEAVRQLLSHLMGGLPLPYFILLKIAQDILEIVPRLLAPSTDKRAT